MDCFREFNRKGGAVVPLQTGGYMYFARAAILAIYGDQPAARKCSLTGSACPVCFTPANKMSLLVQEPRYALKRTAANMNTRTRVLNVMKNGPGQGASDKAVKRAKRIGVNLDVTNAWADDKDGEECWVFGPDPVLDNIWQCLPQVTLHGMDEGLTQKANRGILEAVIIEAKSLLQLSATEVHILLWNIHFNVHLSSTL